MASCTATFHASLRPAYTGTSAWADGGEMRLSIINGQPSGY